MDGGMSGGGMSGNRGMDSGSTGYGMGGGNYRGIGSGMTYQSNQDRMNTQMNMDRGGMMRGGGGSVESKWRNPLNGSMERNERRGGAGYTGEVKSGRFTGRGGGDVRAVEDERDGGARRRRRPACGTGCRGR